MLTEAAPCIAHDLSHGKQQPVHLPPPSEPPLPSPLPFFLSGW